MSALPPLDPLDADAPLRGVEVLELAGEYSGYAGKLLSDLGAAVTRVSVTSETIVEPARPLDGASIDPAPLFLHRGKRDLLLNLELEHDRSELDRLVGVSDIVLQSAGADASSGQIGADEIRALNASAIHVILTPFGLDGPAAGYVSADLVRQAAGGLLWLGGYPDTEPIAAFGDQSTLATGIFGAVAALIALAERDRSGEAHAVEVSSQEVLTQALETSLAEYEFTGRVQRRIGDVPREAGSGVFACKDGYVSMVAGRLGTAEAWKRLRTWLVEEQIPEAESLWDEGWDELAFRRNPEAVARFTSIFEDFASRHGKQELYLEAQRRSIALAPVNSLDDVLGDVQLAARDSIVEVRDPATDASGRVPGAPFRISPLGPEPDAIALSDAAETAATPPR
ncbi:MAG TPA: CoA transferase [Gaiellaceae bacterium]